jgi:hypothetical protein
MTRLYFLTRSVVLARVHAISVHAISVLWGTLSCLLPLQVSQFHQKLTLKLAVKLRT